MVKLEVILISVFYVLVITWPRERSLITQGRETPEGTCDNWLVTVRTETICA